MGFVNTRDKVNEVGKKKSGGGNKENSCGKNVAMGAGLSGSDGVKRIKRSYLYLSA